jgi:gas vesicle protein
MMENTGTRMGGQLAAFALGAAVGAGIALLYAPYSGEKTRELLARRGRDVKDRVTGAVGAAVDATKEAIRDQWQNQSPSV